MTLPFLVSLPHASNDLPDRVRAHIALNDEEIRESSDLGTLEIFGSLPVRAVLCAAWSRVLVDLNRGPTQRDRKGVIARIDYQGRSVYRDGFFPDEVEVERRLNLYYWPYHHRLAQAVKSPEITVLFDCHSLVGIGPPEAPDAGKRRCDIVLGNNGDLHGNRTSHNGWTTCGKEALGCMKQAFEKVGFTVSLNYPYAGGFITSHYGQLLAHLGKMAIQIEINQDLYMEMGQKTIHAQRIAGVSLKVKQAFKSIADMIGEMKREKINCQGGVARNQRSWR
jgi:N-formylglutamate deformylase